MPYVQNEKLLLAMLDSHAAGKITPECYRLFEDIVKQRVNVHLKTNVAQHRQPMIDMCMDKIMRIWQNFSFERDNPFAYFYTVIDNTIKLYFAKNCPMDEHGNQLVTMISIDACEERFADSD